MAVDLEKLNELKQKIIQAKDFRDPLNFFFDYFPLSREFLDKSKRVKQHKLIKQIIENVGQQLFTGQINITHFSLYEVQNYHFLHGNCFVSGHAVNILFFSDIDMGLLGIAMEDDRIMTARFSSAMLSSASEKSFYVPNASNAIH